tara:strand:- start:2052 stop:2888 length:837 start_codon:yes stop_codon:yes gene_type:complete
LSFPTLEQRSLYAQEGVFLARNFLSAELLKKARACFDFVRDNPSPRVATAYRGTDQEHIVDDSHPESWDAGGIGDFVRETGIADYLAELFESNHIWYFLDEYFTKEGGRTAYTPWHQDHSVIPIGGMQWVNLWISFESLPAHNCLDVVRGSHLGKLYNGASYRNADDLTDPLHKGSEFERLPDIRADLARDPSSWDVATYDIEPGDVLFFHPYALHGGGPTDEQTPNRHTMVLRFFGDDAVYSPLPHTNFNNGGGMWSFLESVEPGAPFRSKKYYQLR